MAFFLGVYVFILLLPSVAMTLQRNSTGPDYQHVPSGAYPTYTSYLPSETSPTYLEYRPSGTHPTYGQSGTHPANRPSGAHPTLSGTPTHSHHYQRVWQPQSSFMPYFWPTVQSGFNYRPGAFGTTYPTMYDPVIYSPRRGPICFPTGMECSVRGKCCDYQAMCSLDHICCKKVETDCIYHKDCCGHNSCVDRQCCRRDRAHCIRNTQCCSKNCVRKICRPTPVVDWNV